MASITGTGSNDTLNGTGAADTVRGLGGEDRLDGGGGSDSVDGGDGNDVIVGHAGDTLKGSLGIDLLVLQSFAASANFDLSALTAATSVITANGTLKASGFEWVELDGGDFNDNIIASDFADSINANGGNDNIVAGVGDDFVNGGAGDDSIDGGDGFDRIGFAGAANGVHVDLRLQGTAQNTGTGNDILMGFENVSGTMFSDTLIGDANNNILIGVGTAGDVLFGDEGDDLISVVDGAHNINGSDGVDLLSVYGGGHDTSAGVHIDLNLQGAVPQDTGIGLMVIKNVEGLSGTGFADALTGDFFNNILAGVDGADTLLGGAGEDVLYGDGRVEGDFAFGLSGSVVASEALYGADASPGADSIDGGKGDDIIVGGGGADVLTGGKDLDAFWYFRVEDSLVTARDTITDFNPNYDTLDLSAIDANTAVDGDQAFTLVYAYTNTAGEALVAYDRDTDTSTLSLDVNGDSVSDAEILFAGRLTILNLDDGTFIA